MRISDPTELKVGDVFYECHHGMNFRLVVTEVPIFRDDKWQWKAVDSKGMETNFLITKGYEHYGPKIYRQPAYLFGETQ